MLYGGMADQGIVAVPVAALSVVPAVAALYLFGNKHNAFHPQLTAMRAGSVARARELPVVANPGVGGRPVKGPGGSFDLRVRAR